MATRFFDNFVNTLDQKLEKPVKKHLKDVYSTLALCLLAAAVGAYIHVATDILKGNFLVALASIGLLVALYMTPPNGQNDNMRWGLLLGFAGCTGLSTGPLMDIVIQINPSIIVSAFMGTCVIFGCFTLAALYAPDRKFLYLGGMLMSALSTLLWLSLFNLFFASRFLFQINLYVGLLVMCGFVLYDTQLIIEKRRRGDTDYIWHSVDLFIDFMDIFRRLMIILAQKESNSNKKRKD